MGQTIVRALTRPFQRIVLGGVRDETPIRDAARGSRFGTKRSLQRAFLHTPRFQLFLFADLDDL